VGNALRIRQATRRFGRHEVFSGLDLDLPAGSRLLLIGANGSGKTTLLRCLAGTLALTAGQASVDGHPVGSLAARRATGVCLAPEQGLYGRLSGHDNLMLAARLRMPRRAAAEAVARVEDEFELTRFVGLPVQACSAGMRARLSLARAFVGEPSTLLLDEPDRSLDDGSRALLWAALDRRPRTTCVVASHRPADRGRCDRTLTLPVVG
jgi:ABC-type multidrug transport system ATPase subunit